MYAKNLKKSKFTEFIPNKIITPKVHVTNQKKNYNLTLRHGILRNLGIILDFED